ncbi:NERD domain-containing protein [Pseudarthrobacter sp. NamE2]|uniref:nuclease-related domain-containing protein n=1 Tax=Pseudarthrobacter sp. NamE2 TaxID=2576838 RepID=UPI0010FCE763|nr:nuclease-related domain-containing protein [Pseudarthrobacter sp. NamE2]TLM81370.1 NERD domain-containing protein [Pseudarthrobacter sp. NamE2]
MGAGDGAAEQSRLAAERVARLKRQLDQAERSTRAWDAGAAGARTVADKLSQLVPRGWYVLHDVHWPGRPKANLDHVLVGPGGIVVVDAKNWTGEVRVSSGVLWQGRYARTQAVEGALAQCAAVASVMAPPYRRLVRPLICMAGQPDLFGITSSDVAVAGADRVVGAVESLPAVLDQQAVVNLYEYLGQELTHEQEPGITAFRNVPAGTVVRPAGGLPPGGRPAEDARAEDIGAQETQTKDAGAEVPKPEEDRPEDAGLEETGAEGAQAGRAGTSGARTQGTAAPAARRTGSPTGAHRGSRNRGGSTSRHPAARHLSAARHGGEARHGRAAKAHQPGATSAGRLALLAAFVIFAVYVLPYWTQ